jgi:hypothetical protein
MRRSGKGTQPAKGKAQRVTSIVTCSTCSSAPPLVKWRVPLFPGENWKTDPCFLQLNLPPSLPPNKAKFQVLPKYYGHLENQKDVQVYVCGTWVNFLTSFNACFLGWQRASLILTTLDLGVLSAFSQAQKEHRRHSVHLATLRAHGEVSLLVRGLLLIAFVTSEKDRER